MKARKRVVVSGMGAITSLGNNVSETWEAMIAGKSGIKEIEQFDSRDFPVRIGGEINLENIQQEDKHGLLDKMSRAARFGVLAMDEALEDAGLNGPEIDKTPIGVCVGAYSFPLLESRLLNPGELLKGGDMNLEYYLRLCKQNPGLITQTDMPSVTALMAAWGGLCGPNYLAQGACASATQAIGKACELIRDGDAEVVVTGGTDSMLSVIYVSGFTLLGALSTQNEKPKEASRPFDEDRDGFVLGEGAGILIVEELEHALNRNAKIYAEIVGNGTSSDAYRFTDSHPTGKGAHLSMERALEDAGIKPEQVDHINAHGTATFQNDRVEVMAIKSVFGERAYQIPISSNKSQLGHLVCAAGGIEMIAAINSINHGIVAPTINLHNPDPECDLDFVPNKARMVNVDVAMSNSFGFGGQNATVVAKKFQVEENA